MEIREVLQEFGFDSENTPIVIGSALNTLEVLVKICFFHLSGFFFQISIRGGADQEY